MRDTRPCDAPNRNTAYRFTIRLADGDEITGYIQGSDGMLGAGGHSPDECARRVRTALHRARIGQSIGLAERVPGHVLMYTGFRWVAVDLRGAVLVSIKNRDGKHLTRATTNMIKIIKQRHGAGIWLQLTAEMDRGRYVIEMRPDDGASDGTLLTAIEARRLSKALDAFADATDKSNAR